MCETDYDRPTIHVARIRKARIKHRCGECCRIIFPGEEYQYVIAMYDNEFETFKTCLHCLQGQKLLLEKCNGFLYCGIDEDLTNHIDAGVPWWMQAARIVIGMHRQWRRFKDNELMRLKN